MTEARGTDEDFEVVLRRHVGLLKSIVQDYYLVGGARDDLMQEARLGLWEAWRDFDAANGGAFSSFAFVVVRRKVLTAVKASTRRKHEPLRSFTALEEVAGTVAEPRRQDATETVAAHDEWARASRRLTPLEAKSVTLVWGYGYSCGEAGAYLGTTGKAADNAVQRARKKLVSAAMTNQGD